MRSHHTSKVILCETFAFSSFSKFGEAGVITASQRKFDARVILGLFLPGAEVPWG